MKPIKMNYKKQLKALGEVDGIVDLLIGKLVQIKNDCRKARKKLESVSTSSVRQGYSKESAEMIAKRNASIKVKPAIDAEAERQLMESIRETFRRRAHKKHGIPYPPETKKPH